MEKQRWKESEKRREEERRSETRKSQKKEDAGARKVKVAKHCVFPMKVARHCGAKHISKSKCTKHTILGPLLEVAMSSHAIVAPSTCPSQRCKKIDGFAALLDVQMLFRMAGARDFASCQKRTKREGFEAVPKTMAGVGHLKRIWKDSFCVAGADFLRRGVFWSIRSSVLGR